MQLVLPTRKAQLDGAGKQRVGGAKLLAQLSWRCYGELLASVWITETRKYDRKGKKKKSLGTVVTAVMAEQQKLSFAK